MCHIILSGYLIHNCRHKKLCSHLKRAPTPTRSKLVPNNCTLPDARSNRSELQIESSNRHTHKSATQHDETTLTRSHKTTTLTSEKMANEQPPHWQCQPSTSVKTKPGQEAHKQLTRATHGQVYGKVLQYTKTIIFLVKSLEVVAKCCLG